MLNPTITKAQSDIIDSLDSIISTCKATVADIETKFKEIPSDLIYDSRDIGHVSDIRRPIVKDCEQRIANCKELKVFVMKPSAEEPMALAVAAVNEYVRQANRKQYFSFLSNKPPISFTEKKLQPLLTSSSSQFETAMTGLRSPDDIKRHYQNALDKLTADLASVAGKKLSEDNRKRQQVFHWTVFVNTLNEYGKAAFASKPPSS